MQATSLIGRGSAGADPSPRVRRAVRFGAALIAVLAVARAPADGPTTMPTDPSGRSMGKWLVDLARDYPFTPQAGVTDADAELTLALLRAASRVEPTLAEAYLWQQDLLRVLGREADALAAMTKYVERSPDDQCARVLWIAMQTETLQTLEQRVAFWKQELARPAVPNEVASDLHRRMAEYYFNRGEHDAARAELDESLKAFPRNVAAERLRTEVLGTGDDPAVQLEAALALVRVSPAQPWLAWDVAAVLDAAGMHREAQSWYTHALTMFQKARPPLPVPPDFMADMATSLADAGQVGSAEQIARQLLDAHRDDIATLCLAARVSRLAKRPDESTARLARARALYEAELKRLGDRVDPEILAEIAWYYCAADPQPDKAYELASKARSGAVPVPLADRAFGYAAARLGKADEAKAALEPLVPHDPWAALGLAIATKDAANADAVAERLTALARRHRSGLLFDRISEQLTAMSRPIPPAPATDALRRALDAFDGAVLAFPTAPEAYIELSVTPLSLDPHGFEPGQAITCRFTLRNKGSFGITLGDELMVSPVVLVPVRSSGDRDRDQDSPVRIALNRRQELAPGQSLSIVQTLDIGSLRTTLISTPQAVQRIRVSAILSPMHSDEANRWMPRPGGLEVGPVLMMRTALVPDADVFQRTLQQARGGSPPERALATDRLVMWVAEQQHLRAGRLAYATRGFDVPTAMATIHERFADPAWEVRARLAEAIRWFVLDPATEQDAARLLNDPHWLVRLLAVRAFADHQKERFEPVASVLERQDPDELVRIVCRSVRQRWAAATQPAASDRGAAPPAP